MVIATWARSIEAAGPNAPYFCPNHLDALLGEFLLLSFDAYELRLLFLFKLILL